MRQKCAWWWKKSKEKYKKYKNIRNLFTLKKENGTTESKIIRNIKTLFEDYYKPVKGGIFGATITLNLKWMTIETKPY